MSTKYAVGDKVVIVSRLVDYMNPKMDIYLGKTMTIKEITEEVNFPYFMVEDQGTRDGNRCWYWNDDMIDHEATERLQRELALTTVTCPHCGQVIEGIEGIDYIIEDGNVLCKDCIEADEDSKIHFLFRLWSYN